MATDDMQLSKGQYTELIAMFQELRTKLEPYVDPNSEFRQALSRRLKDLPKDDENVQTIVQGLAHFRNINNIAEHNIEVLQQLIKEKDEVE